MQYTKDDETINLNPDFQTFTHKIAYIGIQAGDIVLNPKSELAFFKYKSNNKNLISWRLGLPVAETPEDFELLQDPLELNKQVQEMYPLLKSNDHIGQSAVQETSTSIRTMTQKSSNGD